MSEKGILKIEGITCDNPKCDYENRIIDPSQYEFWVNKPCPKCGQLLLTEQDLKILKLFGAVTAIANKIEPEEVALPTETGKVYTSQKEN